MKQQSQKHQHLPNVYFPVTFSLPLPLLLHKLSIMRRRLLELIILHRSNRNFTIIFRKACMKSKEFLNINDFRWKQHESTTIALKQGHLTDKSDHRVGHLNPILARGGGNLNDPIFKSSNARGLPWGKGGGGWMLKFRVDFVYNT